MSLLHPFAPHTRQRSRQIVEHHIENVVPSEGIYYCLLQPEGMELYGYRFDDYPQIDHVQFWERFVAPVLAYRWARKLQVNADELERAMRPLAYALPRGRVARNLLRRFVVYYGAMVCPASVIQRFFGLPETAAWETDEHEQCQQLEKETFRSLVRTELDWSAV